MQPQLKHLHLLKKQTKILHVIDEIKNTAKNLREAGAVIGCFLAANTKDKKALILQAEVGSLGARFQTAVMKLQQSIAKTDETVWTELLATEQLSQFDFVLQEWRKEVEMKLSEEEESLITALSVDGYQGGATLRPARRRHYN